MKHFDNEHQLDLYVVHVCGSQHTSGKCRMIKLNVEHSIVSIYTTFETMHT